MVLILALSGCDTGGNTTAGTTAGTTTAGTTKGGTTTAPTAEELEEVTLVWYSMINRQQDTDLVYGKIAEYLKEQINVKLEYNFVDWGAPYYEKIKTLVGSGMAPDFFFMSPAAGFVEFAQREALYPLEDLFPVYMPQTLAKTPEGALDAVTVNGHVYAVVPVKDLAENNSFLYNQDWVDEFGVEIPKWNTLYDILPLFYELRELRDEKYPDKKDIPIAKIYNVFYRWHPMEMLVPNLAAVNITGIESIEGKAPGTEVFAPYTMNEFKENSKLLSKLVKDRIFPFDHANFDKDQVIFNSGDMFAGWNQGYIEVPIDLYKFPTKLQTQNISMMYTGYIQAALNCIGGNTKHPERVAMLLELFNNDQYIATTARFGIEGENYILTADGQADLANSPKNKGLASNERPFYNWYAIQIGDITACHLPTDVTLEFGNKVKTLNETAIRTDNLGFIPDLNPIQNEIAACSSVISEYVNPTSLSSGMLDDATIDTLFDEMVAKLESNGQQKIVDEIQKQLDAWRTSVGK